METGFSLTNKKQVKKGDAEDMVIIPKTTRLPGLVLAILQMQDKSGIVVQSAGVSMSRSMEKMWRERKRPFWTSSKYIC